MDIGQLSGSLEDDCQVVCRKGARESGHVQWSGGWIPGGFQVVLLCESFKGQSEGYVVVWCISRHWCRFGKLKKLSHSQIRTRLKSFFHSSTIVMLTILAAWLKWLHFIFSLSSLFPHIWTWYYYSHFSDDILVIYKNHPQNFGGLKELLIITCSDFSWLAGFSWVVLPWTLSSSWSQMADGAGDTESGHLRWFPHSCAWGLIWDYRNSWRLAEHLPLPTVSLCWASSQHHSIRVVGLLTWLLASLKLVFWETKASYDLASLLLRPISHYMQPSLMWERTAEEWEYCDKLHCGVKGIFED